MRYFKKTFIWLIVLVGIAGYSYLDFENTRINEAEKEEASRLLPFKQEEVLAIVLKKGDGVIELERWDDGWKIIKPYEAKGDNEGVEKFLKNVIMSKNDAEYVMDTDPSPERLAEFGLANPTIFLTLKVGKELTEHTLILGDRAPSMGVAFARMQGEKPVYRILADVRAEADKDINYFRDKTILRLNPIMIDQMSINRGDKTILVKLPESGMWELEKPLKARADHQRVFQFLTELGNREVKDFTAESKENLAQYGLDKPSIEILFWLSGDSEPTIRLKVGNRDPKKRGYYVEMSDRNNIFMVEEKLVDSIPSNPNDFRSRELVFFDREYLKRIEIHDEGKSVVLVKDIEKEWRLGKEEGDTMDFNLVKAFLDELLDIRIEDFLKNDHGNLKEFGLEPPRARLLLWLDGSSVPMGISVGKTTPAGNMVYATYGGSKEVITVSDDIKRVLKTYLF